MHHLPLGCCGIGRDVAHAKAAQIAAAPLRFYYGPIPWAIVCHRPFDGKIPRVAIDDNQDKCATGHETPQESYDTVSAIKIWRVLGFIKIHCRRSFPR